MRLSLSINGERAVVAALPGPGYLNAHLSVSDRPAQNECSKRVWIDGRQTREAESASLEWLKFDVHEGDTIELRVLGDGEGDPPAEVRMSPESPGALFLDPELARQLLAAVADFSARLTEIKERSEMREPLEEHNHLSAALRDVGDVLRDRLLYPIYRRHKELVPEELKGEV